MYITYSLNEFKKVGFHGETIFCTVRMYYTCMYTTYTAHG